MFKRPCFVASTAIKWNEKYTFWSKFYVPPYILFVLMQYSQNYNCNPPNKQICGFDTLRLAVLYYEFTFRAHFQCVIRTYDLNCVEYTNQRVSTQGKIHEYSYEMGSISVLTNQSAFLKNRY